MGVVAARAHARWLIRKSLIYETSPPTPDGAEFSERLPYWSRGRHENKLYTVLPGKYEPYVPEPVRPRPDVNRMFEQSMSKYLARDRSTPDRSRGAEIDHGIAGSACNERHGSSRFSDRRTCSSRCASDN